MAVLREGVMRLWSEVGLGALTPGSKSVLVSLVMQQFFIKDVAPGEVVPVGRVSGHEVGSRSRLLGTLEAQGVLGGSRGQWVEAEVQGMSRASEQLAAVEGSPHEPGGPEEAENGLGEGPQPGACPPAHIRVPFPEINVPVPVTVRVQSSSHQHEAQAVGLTKKTLPKSQAPSPQASAPWPPALPFTPVWWPAKEGFSSPNPGSKWCVGTHWAVAHSRL